MRKILVVMDNYPTVSFKRDGVFGYDDVKFLKTQGYEINVLILFRIEVGKAFVFNPIAQISKLLLKVNELRQAINNDVSLELITYFSIIKPFVFKEDLFLNSNSRFRNLNFDYVIVHKMLHVGLNIDWLKKQFPKAKFILKEHSDWTLHSRMLQYFQLKKMNSYDQIWFNSEYNKNNFESLLNKTRHKSSKIKLLVDYPKFQINTEKIVKTRPENYIRILTVANLIKEKGFDEAFEVIKILNNNVKWHWTIVGKGDYLEKIKEFSVKFNFTENIEIIDELNKDLLYEQYKKSDIYLQLTYLETFGIAPIEAYSFYNKLIVSANIASINELKVNDERNILIIPDLNNIYKISNKIMDFINKPINYESIEGTINELNNKINRIRLD